MRDLQERGDDSWSSGVQSLWGEKAVGRKGEESSLGAADTLWDSGRFGLAL